MLQPLEAAIAMAISQDKEKSWFPSLSMLVQIVCGLFYNLMGLASMRSTIDKVNHSPELGIGEVSLSTFSDAMNSPRRLKVLRQVFNSLLLCFSDRIPRQLQKFRHIAAIDSTIIQCVLSAVWADYRKSVNACKAHVVFNLGKGIPDALVLSAAKIHDRKYFEIFLKKGWTYIVDRGYNDYSLFDAMIDLGIFFVTRIKSNASYRVVKKKRLKRRHRKRGVISDEIIHLGAGPNEMKNDLRLVTFEAEDGRIFHFLTSRLDLSPVSIAALYQARWGIEIFFKFLKRTLRGVRPLARSQFGVEAHVLLALITDLLLKCLAKAIGRWDRVKRHVPVTFMRIVRDSLFHVWTLGSQTFLAEALP
jgi:putative transposase